MGGEESRKHVTVCAAKGAAESRESEVQRARRLGCRGKMGVGSRGSCRGGDRTQEKVPCVRQEAHFYRDRGSSQMG